MPKTGSSAIQAFLACNTDLLKKFDYCFPWHPGFGQAFQTSAGNATNLHHWIIDRNVDELEKSIDSLTENNVILSSEVLFHTARLHPKEFYEALKKYNITIICYIRKIDDLIDSCVNQLVKNHGMTDYSDLDTIIDDHDYATTLINLSEYIDMNKINIRVYDRSEFPNGDIYQDFLEATDLAERVSINELREPEKSINPSLVPEAFKTRLLLNKVNFENKNSQQMYNFNAILAKYSVNKNKNKNKYSILTKEEREVVFEKYEERETKLNKKFNNSQCRLFNSITEIKNLEVTDEEISDVLHFIRCENPNAFDNILKKTIENSELPTAKEIQKIIKNTLLNKLDHNKKLEINTVINKPYQVVLPYNFKLLTHSYSEDFTVEYNQEFTKLNCTGDDPYFTFKKINSISKTSITIIISLHSTVECKAQLHFQTNSEPFFGNKKFHILPVKKGYNNLKFLIERDDLNGVFRFDPIMQNGTVYIYSSAFY